MAGQEFKLQTFLVQVQHFTHYAKQVILILLVSGKCKRCSVQKHSNKNSCLSQFFFQSDIKGITPTFFMIEVFRIESRGFFCFRIPAMSLCLPIIAVNLFKAEPAIGEPSQVFVVFHQIANQCKGGIGNYVIIKSCLSNRWEGEESSLTMDL